jgi:hypothetical protein
MSKKFKVWSAVGPLPFTANGTTDGIIILASTFGLFVGQNLTVSATSLPTKQVEIKDVISKTQIRVGPQDGNPDRYTALNLYTTALSASITAPEQPYGVDAPNGQVLAGVYENLPIAALRNVLVDPTGFFYTTDNPLPVQLSDGSVNIETLNAQLEVHLSHTGTDFDSVRIGDGTEIMAVNPDGSINANPTDYAIQLDDTSTPNITYVGYAAIGSATSAAVWRIKRIDETSGLVITWADSNNNFDNIWSNRTGLTYG